MSEKAGKKGPSKKAPSKKAPAKKKAGKKKTESVPVGTSPERLYDFADTIDTRDASRDGPDERQQDLETWVTFTLGGEHFALPVAATREVLRIASITRVPHAPYSVRGIINMRGRSVPVIDLRLRLGLGDSEIGAQSRALITETRGRYLGLLVDSVERVEQLDRNLMAAAPADVMTDQSEYIVGVYPQDYSLLILLDVEKVLLLPDSLESVNSGK